MNDVALLLLSHLNLPSAFIGTGSLVGEAELFEAQDGACELTFGATEFEPDTTWGLVAFADGEPEVPSVYFAPADVPGVDGGECLNSSGFEICESIDTFDVSAVEWEATVLIPVGTTYFDIYATDTAETHWLQTQELEVSCGTCDLYGDFNGDGLVGTADMIALFQRYGQTVAGTGFRFLDAPEYLTGEPRDGVVGIADWTAFLQNWRATCDGV